MAEDAGTDTFPQIRQSTPRAEDLGRVGRPWPKVKGSVTTMPDAGIFKLLVTPMIMGEHIITCRELPDFHIAAAPGSDFVAQIGTKLRQHLSSRYGVDAELTHEDNVIQFRCSIVA